MTRSDRLATACVSARIAAGLAGWRLRPGRGIADRLGDIPTTALPHRVGPRPETARDRACWRAVLRP